MLRQNAARRLPTLILLAVLLVACRPGAATPDVNTQITQAVQTAFASLQQTQSASTPVPTNTPVPTPTVPRTPPALPSIYVSSALDPLDTPHTYIQDTCQYLKDKWASANSAPGTIVMAVMFHSINKSAGGDPNDITATDFKKMMNALKEGGFEAIHAAQLADFLDHNARIPARSVILIQDDRHYADNFNTHFRPFYEKWGWPVVNSWISADDSIRKLTLAENIALSNEGWVDYESHGTVHNIPMSDSSSDAYIQSELQGSIADLQQNFHKTPVAIIWPGGGFGLRPIQFARQFGYRIGFTINPRGPLMFNWIPLADRNDPRRPSYLAEGYAGDPRLTLPRYWPYQVLPNIDLVRTIGQQAADQAAQNKAAELEYYDILCTPTFGPIP